MRILRQKTKKVKCLVMYWYDGNDFIVWKQIVEPNKEML